MGAAPERSHLAFVSPLRESEVRNTLLQIFPVNLVRNDSLAFPPTPLVWLANAGEIRAPIFRCRFA